MTAINFSSLWHDQNGFVDVLLLWNRFCFIFLEHKIYVQQSSVHITSRRPWRCGKACFLSYVQSKQPPSLSACFAFISSKYEDLRSNKFKCSRAAVVNFAFRFRISRGIFSTPSTENSRRSISVWIRNSWRWICAERKPFRHGAWSWKFVNISFTTHWGGRPQQQGPDLLTTITMFDQIKAEPLHFYQSSCPTQITAQINPNQQHQVTAVLQQGQIQTQQNATVVTINDDKDNLQVSVEAFIWKEFIMKIPYTALRPLNACHGRPNKAGDNESDADYSDHSSVKCHQHSHSGDDNDGHRPEQQTASVQGVRESFVVSKQLLCPHEAPLGHKALPMWVDLIKNFRWSCNSFPSPGSVCDAAFCRKPYLEVHMRVHTGRYGEVDRFSGFFSGFGEAFRSEKKLPEL